MKLFIKKNFICHSHVNHQIFDFKKCISHFLFFSGHQHPMFQTQKREKLKRFLIIIIFFENRGIGVLEEAETEEIKKVLLDCKPLMCIFTVRLRMYEIIAFAFSTTSFPVCSPS